MPVTMEIKLDDFLTALYEEGLSHPVAMRTVVLRDKGWKFTFQMFLIHASKFDGQAQVNVPENMPSLIPALMGGKTTGTQLQIFRSQFEKFIGNIEKHEEAIAAGAPPTQVGTLETQSVAAAAEEAKKALVKKIAKGSKVNPEDTTAVAGTPAPATPATPKKEVPGVCHLKDAASLGQMVYGTSDGSVYRTVAVGPVNVAARVAQGAISIRVEGSFTPSILKSLAEMGFSKKADYASMHCAVSPTMPPSRVVGAVLLGLNLQWKEMIINGGEVK